eukprot:COSAG06_NODE_43364_length_372_cov_2.340659_1_plen_75_part_10
MTDVITRPSTACRVLHPSRDDASQIVYENDSSHYESLLRIGADPTITNRRGATAKEGVQVDSEKMANMEALEAAH